jgi:hypothetical protein
MHFEFEAFQKLKQASEYMYDLDDRVPDRNEPRLTHRQKTFAK